MHHSANPKTMSMTLTKNAKNVVPVLLLNIEALALDPFFA